MHTHRPDVLHAPGPLVRRFLRVQAISPALVFRALISVAAIHAIAALTTDRCLADEEATVERGDRRYFELATPEAKDLSPLLLRILSPPVPFPKSDGKSHLLTELLLTNSDKASLQIQRVEVLDGEAMKVLRSFTGEEVAANMTLLNNPADTDILPAGQTGLVYLDVAVDPPHVPRTVVHKILARNGTRTITVTGAKIAVDTMTNLPVFGSPFTGGTWVASDAASPRSHHRRGPFNLNGELYLSQRYAIDFLKIVDGKLWEGDNPKDLQSWYTYGQEALAPANGRVVLVWDGEPEVTPFEKNPSKLNVDNVAGNHLMFDVGGGLFVVYGHLQPGSIKVKVGDRVTKGDRVGLIGNSGNTDAPHLHMHVMDSAKVIQADGIPFLFDRFTAIGRYESLDTLLPDPLGTSPEPMIRFAEQRKYRGKYPTAMSVLSWPAAR